VAEPFLGAPSPDTEPFAETVLRLSPLTSVLHRPTLAALDRGAAAETAAAAALLSRPRGAEVLRTALARWCADPEVLRWRTDLLARFALPQEPSRRDVALDTYVTARLRHGAAWDERLRAAARGLAGRGAPAAVHIATARYWAPLAALWRTDPDLVRSRPYLTGCEAALALVQRYGLPATGAA
jgi:hypothetical protein